MTQEEFQTHVIENLAELKVNMHNLVGNGQPGRVKVLEDKVESLGKWRWIVTGGIIAISAVIHFIFKY
jgi:hypothetical protein